MKPGDGLVHSLHRPQNPASQRGWSQGFVPLCSDCEFFPCFVPCEKKVTFLGI
jgi:hypothetical protein